MNWEEITSLIADGLKYRALEGGGVDNWEGYGDSLTEDSEYLLDEEKEYVYKYYGRKLEDPADEDEICADNIYYAVADKYLMEFLNDF